MSNSASNPQVQALVEAARTLGATQIIAARTVYVRKALESAKASAATALEEAEFAFAEGNFVYWEANLRKLRMERMLRDRQLTLERYTQCESAHRHLWSIASTADEAALVAAAEALAAAMDEYQALYTETKALRVEVATATADLNRATEARDTDMLNLARAQTKLDTAKSALRQFASRAKTFVFEPEFWLIVAACELTGKKEKMFPISRVQVEELPVWEKLMKAAAAHIEGGGAIDDPPLMGKVINAIEEDEIAAIADGAVKPIL